MWCVSTLPCRWERMVLSGHASVALCSALMLCSSAMEHTDFPLAQYLTRIGLPAAPEPSETGLRQVHLAQAFSIPFENFDIHLGRAISLNSKDLVEKLITRSRGGYCFELNGLLHLALRSLGFAVRPLLARVLYRRPDPGARTHEVLIVDVSGRRWLADAGFGGPGLRAPIPLVPDQIEEQCAEFYCLRQDPLFGMALQKKVGDKFIDLYAFDEEEITLGIDIEMANHFTSTWPESIFRLQRMCALPTSRGRVTLADMDLTVYQDGEIMSRTLPPGTQYVEAISDYFGIRLDARYEDLSPLGRI